MPHWKPLPRNSITLAQNSSQSATFHSHNQTWTQPADIFSVLLILGGDVVNRALAQLVGSRVTPVAFSFGMCYNKALPRLGDPLADICCSYRLGVILCLVLATGKCKQRSDNACRLRLLVPHRYSKEWLRTIE